jgi:penicillin-binding protein 1A
MGYTPQLLAGTWIGCDDRFIRIESGLGYGGQAARPIWEAFFKKVYADKTLGISKEAIFEKPADVQHGLTNADISTIIEDEVLPGAEGENVGVGDADDYGSLDTSHEFIGAESKIPVEEDPNKKGNGKTDTSAKKAPKIGDPAPVEDKKKKDGIFRRIFGKKEEEKTNDY